MSIRQHITCTATAILIAAAAFATPAYAVDNSESLARAVPGDVFLCITGQQNPERAFLDEYWSDVFDTLIDTGIGTDLMKLFTGIMDEEQRAEFDRLKNLGTELFNRVDWEALYSREMVFAERFTTYPGQPQFYIGPPEMIMLADVEPAKAEQNYDGLAQILVTLADEINKLAGESAVAITRSEPHERPTTTLSVPGLPPEAPRIWLAVARQDNTLIVAFGQKLFEESLALLSGESSASSITRDPRYQAAFAKLPPAEDSRVFFDLQAMLTPYRNMAQHLPEQIARGSADDIIINSTKSGPAHDLNTQAWDAADEGNYQRGLELVQQAYEIAPEDARVLYYLACFHARTDQKEQALDYLERAVAGGFYCPAHIRRDPDLQSLRNDPRYDSAVVSAKQHASEIATKNASEWAGRVTTTANRLLDAVGMIDYVASTEQTDGYTVRSESLAVLVPNAGQRPFYPVIAARKPSDDLLRFLPKETLSFSATNGPDLDALHIFLRDTVRQFGPEGEAALAWWASFQQQIGFDLERDVLSWLDGDSLSVTLDDGQQWAMFIRVSNEALAREKAGQAVQFFTEQVTQLAAQMPALNMLSATAFPLDDERLPEFQSLRFVMVPQPVVWGVSQGYLIMGSSADAVVRCLDTAAGKHPDIRQNRRLMAQAIMPEGAFDMCSLTDLRSAGDDAAEAIGIVTMISGMAGTFIPEPEARQMLGRIAAMLSKLVPVVKQINFYKSSASCTTFDGQAWHTRTATHYFAPDERPSPTPDIP